MSHSFLAFPATPATARPVDPPPPPPTQAPERPPPPQRHEEAAPPSPLGRNRFALALWLSVAVGLPIFVAALLQLDPAALEAMSPGVWLLGALVVVGETRPLIASKRYGQGGVTPSTAFTFAVMFIWGPAPAIVLHGIASLLADAVDRKEWWKRIFNLSQYSACLAAAWLSLAVWGWQASPTQPHALSAGDLGPMVLSWTVYFVLNNGVVSLVVALRNGSSFWEVFYEDFGYQVFSNVAVLVFSPLVALVATTSPLWLPLVVPPMFAIYATTGMALDREHQANHDALTRLPNRKYLRERLEQALAERPADECVALFLLDLDRFKEVNDTLGHRTGDLLLQHVSERLLDAVRPDDVVARLGGDEFAVLLPTIPDHATALEVAERIRGALDAAFELDGMLLEPEASIGVALAPWHGGDVESLLRCADIAMYVAKEERCGIETYSPDRDRHSTGRLGLLGALRRAIDEGELELHYQPKVSLGRGTVTGVEALVRWRHPTRGLVLPDDFVPLAESSGLMHKLTASVVDEALAQAAQWWDRGLKVPVAVNVSARDLHGAGLARTVSEGLTRHRLPAEAIRLELTERILMAEPARVADSLAELDRLGVRMSLDDFGTGYSSLVLLQRLPVSEIKVDRSFVSRMAVSSEDVTIVRSIIDLAHALGIDAVAEGVESDASWDTLCALGCDSAQGWYVARPMTADAMTEWLVRHPAGRVAGRAGHLAAADGI
ncbi:MAG TPA: EAL domain-containing protein [Actinomycetes bacterium]|nr:EAL domain-containing protein [Actinomycetes bacterium]